LTHLGFVQGVGFGPVSGGAVALQRIGGATAMGEPIARPMQASAATMRIGDAKVVGRRSSVEEANP
jgi:hypothetical protein